jgi:hypothetical protein
VAVTRLLDIRTPLDAFGQPPNPQSRVRTKSIMATREQIWRDRARRRNFLECCG